MSRRPRARRRRTHGAGGRSFDHKTSVAAGTATTDVGRSSEPGPFADCWRKQKPQTPISARRSYHAAVMNDATAFVRGAGRVKERGKRGLIVCDGGRKRLFFFPNYRRKRTDMSPGARIRSNGGTHAKRATAVGACTFFACGWKRRVSRRRGRASRRHRTAHCTTAGPGPPVAVTGRRIRRRRRRPPWPRPPAPSIGDGRRKMAGRGHAIGGGGTRARACVPAAAAAWSSARAVIDSAAALPVARALRTLIARCACPWTFNNVYIRNTYHTL